MLQKQLLLRHALLIFFTHDLSHHWNCRESSPVFVLLWECSPCMMSIILNPFWFFSCDLTKLDWQDVFLQTLEEMSDVNCLVTSCCLGYSLNVTKKIHICIFLFVDLVSKGCLGLMCLSPIVCTSVHTVNSWPTNTIIQYLWQELKRIQRYESINSCGSLLFQHKLSGVAP